MDCSPPGSSVHGDSPGKNTGVGCHALLQGNLPNPGTEPRSPALQVDSLPSEPPGKPKSTGVGSLSLLQGIFPSLESILYQLSYQGRPVFHIRCHLFLASASQRAQRSHPQGKPQSIGCCSCCSSHTRFSSGCFLLHPGRSSKKDAEPATQPHRSSSATGNLP